MPLEPIIYLHCMICSFGGTRPTTDSRIAIVKRDKIHFPIAPEMFMPLYPDRMEKPPWEPGCPWDRMICSRCRRPMWAMTEEEAKAARERGGPDHILITEIEEWGDGEKKEQTRLAKIDDFGIIPLEGSRKKYRDIPGEHRSAADIRDQRADVWMQLYREGNSLKQISKQFGVTPPVVYQMLKKRFPDEYAAIKREPIRITNREKRKVLVTNGPTSIDS